MPQDVQPNEDNPSETTYTFDASRPLKLAMRYARQSVDFEEGIERQHTVNAQIAEQLGYIIPDSPEYRFSDNNVSGTTTRRPGFDPMIEKIVSRNTLARALFVRERDRLGRWNNPKRHDYYAVLCADHGVPIVESTNIDQTDWESDLSDSVEWRMLNDCMARLHARRDRIKIISKSNQGTRARIKLGFFTLKRPFFGTERWLVDGHSREPIRRLIPGQAESRAGARVALLWATDGSLDVVRDIFAWLAGGRSLGWVARQLTERGVTAPGTRYGVSAPGQRWHIERVRTIARNPIYHGDLLYGRTCQRLQGQAPVPASEAKTTEFGMILYTGFMRDAPVTRSEWELVQTKLDQNVRERNARYDAKRTYLLAGALRCALCHRRFQGFTSIADAHGARRQYYRHDASSWGRRSLCTGRRRYVPAPFVEQNARDLLRAMLARGTFDRLLRDAVGDTASSRTGSRDESALREAHERATTLTTQLRNANAAILRTTSSAAIRDLEAQRDEIARELEASHAQSAELAAEPDRLAQVLSSLPQVATALKSFRTLMTNGTRESEAALLRYMIPTVLVDQERREVVYRVRATPSTSGFDAR
ncbi:recombinase family protein [Gemmatimonas sp.]|uniref:recombinase family protein n=1 Tax=Gemmatimonas sp. TaxID=1962908 RepID=UPI00286D3928|nr:recombinase family protein [Gemmatimonas sp.]